MFKRVNAFLCSILLFAASVMTAVPVATAAGPNLIANPSLEQGTTLPTAWTKNKWGTNTSAFTYNNTGRTGTKSVTTKTTAYTSGDAKWSADPVNATPNTTYTYSDWYQSTTPTEMTLAVTNAANVVNYIYLGQVATSGPWKQSSFTFTTPANTAKIKLIHSVKSVGQLTIDDASLTANDTTTPPTAPTVNVTAPANGATVSGTTALTANATDAQGIASVQFKVNGANVGTADTTAPYSTIWDTTAVGNGSHVVTAVATNTTNLATTSAAVNVTVSNTTTPPVDPPVEGSNLIPNPSMEEGSLTVPTKWSNNKWGTNTSSFTYKNTGRTGTKSLTTKTTAYTSGDAKWSFDPVAVSPSTNYTFSNWYQSTTSTGVTLAVTNTSGGITYTWIGDVAASAAWKQNSITFKTPANATHIKVLHYVKSVGELTVDDYSLTSATTTPPTAPTVYVTTPTANATVSDIVALTASASDSQAVSSVQFKVNDTNVGAADTTAPYSVNWDSKTVANGSHTVTAVATNSANLSTTSSPVSITVSNTVTPPTAPTVSVTAPANGSTVSNSVNVTANASDTQTVTSVQFKLDGTNLGVADTTAPYSVSWDSKSATNGAHAITAVATNNSNLTTTSSPVNVTVANTVTPPASNLIANPSLEDGAATPTGWTANSWGTNTSNLTYENNGRTGTRSVKVTTTAYTNGDAKWSFAFVPAAGNATYNYSNWYKSNVETELNAMVTLSNGTVQYYYLATVPAATDWREAKTQFTAPAGTTNLTIFQVMAKAGTLQTDDYSMVAHTPAKLNRALVSITFDDSWRSIYDPGFGLLNKYGLKSTQYLNSEPTQGGYPDYMTYDMVKDFAANGHELGWHTRSHANLTTLATSAIGTELSIPTAFLSNINQPASSFQNFATPYGAYNATVVNEIKKVYRSHRSTDVGYNSKDNFDIYNIKVQNVTNTTTPATVQGWVDQAIATNTWLVLVYHEVTAGAADPTYAVTPANLDAELNIIKQSGVAVVTVNQALDEIVPQL